MWLIHPESCQSAPASVACRLPCESCFQKLSTYCTSSAKSLSPASWRRVWKKAPLTGLLSGATCGHSTDCPGEGDAAGYVPRSHAREFPQPESGSSNETPETAGPIPEGSYARWCPITSTWRTLQLSWFQTDNSDCAPLPIGLSESFPKTGGTVNGYLLVRRKWEPATSESDSSCLPEGVNWPTARSRDGNSPDQPRSRREGNPPQHSGAAADQWATPTSHERTHDPRQVDHGEQLANQVGLWSTPTTQDAANDGSPSQAASSSPPLNSQAQDLWGTPRATDGEKGGPGMAFGAGGTPLPAQAASQMWMTPHGMAGTDHTGKPGAGGEFAEAACEWTEQLWKTPQAYDAENTHEPRLKKDRQTRDPETPGSYRADLKDQILSFPTSLPDPATEKPGSESSRTTHGSRQPSHKRRLNAFFVSWLMSFPAPHWILPWPVKSGAEMTREWMARMRARLFRLTLWDSRERTP